MKQYPDYKADHTRLKGRRELEIDLKLADIDVLSDHLHGLGRARSPGL